MSAVDSFDKIVGYMGAVTTRKFVYKGVEYKPHILRVSPGVFRGYTCPAKCGGCCPRFSLDYIPGEKRPYALAPRSVRINKKDYLLFSDLQQDRGGEHFCRNLNMRNGRCNIHESNPFSCDFELLRFHMSNADTRPNQLTTRLYGRGWNMLRVDGERGARCEMLPISYDSRAAVIRKLKRLKQWCEYFDIKHKVDHILLWAEFSTYEEPFIK